MIYKGELIERENVVVDAAYGATFKGCNVSLRKAKTDGHVLLSAFIACRIDITAEEACGMGGSNIFDVGCEFTAPPSS